MQIFRRYYNTKIGIKKRLSSFEKMTDLRRQLLKT